MTPDDQNTTLRFDPARYPFHELIAQYIGAGPLDRLRAGLGEGGVGHGASLYRNMEATEAFRAMYAGLDGPRGAAFYELYLDFLREVVQPQYEGAPIYYQRRPSHRILFRDTPGESRYHRDRDYGHANEEVNYLVPQTAATGTNAMWIERADGAGDFAPAELALGEYLRFDGANCRHGAHRNETDRTRVSFDFRIVPAAIAPADVRSSALGAHSGNPVMDNARSFALLN